MSTVEKVRERIHWIVEDASHGNWQSLENRLTELILDYESKVQDLAQSTPRNHEIALLIQEIRYGFQLMEKRFEAIDKRFEAIDKRFEAMDKRFDDLIHQIDKRFELLTLQIDRRFEQVEKRFNVVFWMMGIGFTFFSFIITYGTFFKN